MRNANMAARLALAAIMAAIPLLCASAASVAGTLSALPPPAPVGALGARVLDPAAGDVVGIAQPILISFAGPIADRASLERSVVITSTRPVSGRFDWLDDRHVQWLPDGFWPAHTDVSVQVASARTEFDVGDALVAVADTSTHQVVVSINDQVVRTMPASMGKPGYETPLGTFPVIEKFRAMVMDSSTYGVPIDAPEGYRIDVEYAVRITWGGVFVHAAPWSVSQQGRANVSHGCINLNTQNAKWFYDNAKKGDPVIVQY
ncbi:MAG TPA: L,D-transpeptidase [Aldersonia sp.]